MGSFWDSLAGMIPKELLIALALVSMDLGQEAGPLATADVVVELAPPVDFGGGLGWSPKGARVALEMEGRSLVGRFDLGVPGSPSIRVELGRSNEFGEVDTLSLDSDRDGRFGLGETHTTTPTVRRGKTWSSFTASVDLPTRTPEGSEVVIEYPLALWFVHDPGEPDVEPVLRWSRRGWMEGSVEVEGETLAVLLAESVMDGIYDERDRWAVTHELGANRRSEEFRRVDDHNWRGESAWRIVDLHPSGLRVTIRPFDPGITRAEEKENRDRYAADRRAPRAESPVAFSHDYELAAKASLDSDKPLFVDFETTWCGPCKQMDALVYTAQAVVTSAGSVVSVKVDGDERKDLAKRFAVSAYPTLILLAPDGTELRRAVGYQSVAEMVEFLTIEG